MDQLYNVHWLNVWNWSAASHSDVGSLVHLTDTSAISGTTLCGKAYPAAKGQASGLTRYCKKCLKKAYAAGYSPGFTRGLPYIANREE